MKIVSDIIVFVLIFIVLVVGKSYFGFETIVISALTYLIAEHISNG